MHPLLSICIPTYNRAELLRLMLQSILPQVQEAGGKVELIVSDNCSPDHTAEVAQWARRFGPFQYHRNAENIGATRNFLRVTNELASGEYCWILGDDDMLVRGKLPKIIAALENNADLDYFCINYFYKKVADRDQIIREHDSVYSPEREECMGRDYSERRLEQWEELFDVESMSPVVLMTSLLTHVFRRSAWRDHSKCLNLGSSETDGPRFESLDDTFPHVKILAHAMVGKPAYYLGDPCVLLGMGSQEWIGCWPAICLVRIEEFIRLFETLGVRKRRIRRLREVWLKEAAEALRILLLDPKSPGHEAFSLERYVRNNWHHPIRMARLLLLTWRFWLPERLPRPVYQVLRAAKNRLMRGCSGGESKESAGATDTDGVLQDGK